MGFLRFIILFSLIVVVSAFKVGMSTTPLSEKPKNIILLIGDGMGLPQVALMQGHSSDPFYLDSFPVIGLQKTHSATHHVTDSGASATAMATGHKTYNNAIGVGADTLPVTNIMELARAKNLKTGLVVTSSITNATPASFVAHQTYRGFNEQIALDYVSAGLDFIVGGGRDFFTHRFFDDRNLLDEMGEMGYYIFANPVAQIHKKIDDYNGKYLFFTAPKAPVSRKEGRTYLPSATAAACDFLSQSPNGFFLMVEGSQIDFALHRNNKYVLISELKDFNETIGEALRHAQKDGETLVIVTGDHECGGLTIERSTSSNSRQKFAFTTKRHTSQMVPVFAYGPGAELFEGVYENTEIFEKMRSLLDL